MTGTYDEETKRLIENRKRKAALRRAEQAAKRKKTLMLMAAAGVVLIIIIIICFSCSGGEDNEKQPVTVAETETTTVAETETVPETTREILYTNASVRFRGYPSTSASIISVIPEGTEVELISDRGEWYQIKYGNNTGYVMKEYLSGQR